MFGVLACKQHNLENSKALRDSTNEYVLFYSPDKDLYKLDSLVITNKEKKQKIDLSDIVGKFPKHQLDFFLNDINFDGFSDVQIPNYIGNTDINYSFFIYNTHKNMFIHNKGMDSIINPDIIASKKEICSKWHDGLDYFNLYKYSWQGDSLIAKEKYEENWSPINGEGHLKISKFVNGNYEIQEKKIKDRFVENMKCE